MSVPRQSTPPNEVDLESTAELPVLDVAAFEAGLEEVANPTDTWAIPPTMTAAAQAAQGERFQLEADLRALTASLREVEERLGRKGERLALVERELEAATAAREAAEKRSESLAAALEIARTGLAAAEARTQELQQALDADGETRAQLASRDHMLRAAREELRAAEARAESYLETLASLEGRRLIFETQLLSLHRELEDRDVSLASLEARVTSLSAELRAARERAEERDRRVAVLEKEVNAIGAALASRDAELLDAQRAQAQLLESVHSLNEKLEARAERIRALEATAERQTEAESEWQRDAARLAAERDELAARVSNLESVLNEVGVQLAAATTAAEQAAAARAAAEARAREAEIQSAERLEDIRLLREELQAGITRAQEQEADLRAAEETIHRTEAELRSKTAKLEELTRTSEEWRSTLEEARQLLFQRDSLIHRLEAEAASSALLLGNIQQSIHRLDPGNSGTHEIVPEGAVRLLIRTEGDSEVVHVLGRKTSIGRTPDNDLQIDAKFVSRHHAVILAGPTQTIIEDLNSTNGVLVNSRRITRQALRDGDAVAIGKATFRFAVRPTAERR